MAVPNRRAGPSRA